MAFRPLLILLPLAFVLAVLPAAAQTPGDLFKRLAKEAARAAERGGQDRARGARESAVSAHEAPPGAGLPMPDSKRPMAAAASWGTVVIHDDGSVTAWPDQGDGRAVQMALPLKAVAAAVNQYSAFILLEDGTVMGVGKNNYRSLGHDGPASDTPRAIPGLHGIVQVAAAYGHALALRRDGVVFAWGEEVSGLRGELREGMAPVTAVRGLPPIVQVATAARHSLALAQDGRVYAWGANGRGELGRGDRGEPATPGVVPGLDEVVGIAAGLQTSLAIKRDGSVWTWGSNQSAMLGTGSRGESSGHGNALSPMPVRGLRGVQQIVAGEGFVLARAGDGAVHAWGFDGYGGIGVGTAGSYYHTPTRIPTLANVVNVNAGGYRAFATTSDGRLWHWGTAIPVAPGRRPIVKSPVPLPY